MKAIKFTYYLAGWIILIFGSGIMMTFVNDWIQASGFFGDVPFVPYKSHYGIMITRDSKIDGQWVWGTRHYWYYWMCFFLWILSVVRCIIWCNQYWEEKP